MVKSVNFRQKTSTNPAEEAVCYNRDGINGLVSYRGNTDTATRHAVLGAVILSGTPDLGQLLLGLSVSNAHTTAKPHQTFLSVAPIVVLHTSLVFMRVSACQAAIITEDIAVVRWPPLPGEAGNGLLYPSYPPHPA